MSIVELWIVQNSNHVAHKWADIYGCIVWSWQVCSIPNSRIYANALVVFIFTSLLFLSGYVLQQQTVRSIQAAIKPPPLPVPILPPSPVLAKHFGTPPGHSFYDKYLASNRPKGGWAKVAYVQLVREHIHVCNAVMLFAALEREESMAQRIILYPKTWDKQSSDRERLNSQLETSIRLLRNAASRYRVMLQPVEPMLDMGHGTLYPNCV